MSRGLGRIQRQVLELLSREPERHWTAIDLAVEVYSIEPGEDGWIIPNASVVAVRRALLGLKRRGKVGCHGRYYHGRRHWFITPSPVEDIAEVIAAIRRVTST